MSYLIMIITGLCIYYGINKNNDYYNAETDNIDHRIVNSVFDEEMLKVNNKFGYEYLNTRNYIVRKLEFLKNTKKLDSKNTEEIYENQKGEVYLYGCG